MCTTYFLECFRNVSLKKYHMILLKCLVTMETESRHATPQSILIPIEEVQSPKFTFLYGPKCYWDSDTIYSR